MWIQLSLRATNSILEANPPTSQKLYTQGDKILTYLLIKVSTYLRGLFWQEESDNRALFVKLLWHRKSSFNILECLISENFRLW